MKLKLKVRTRLPAALFDGLGITIASSGLTRTPNLDYSKLNVVSTFTPVNKLIVVQDKLTGQFNTVTADTLSGGGTSGAVLAANNGSDFANAATTLSNLGGQPLDADLTKLAALGQWTVAYNNGTGTNGTTTALAVGADKTLFAGNGTTSAPSWRTLTSISANCGTLDAPGNWKVTYSNGSGVIVALAIGAAGTVLGSTGGASAAPVMTTLDAFGGVLLAGNQNLTGGFTVTSYSGGTISSGTFTPAATNQNMQYITANGAFILGVPSSECSICLEVTNGSSAGSITTSGYTRVVGDTYLTTNTYKFLFHILKTHNYSRLFIEALQ